MINNIEYVYELKEIGEVGENIVRERRSNGEDKWIEVGKKKVVIVNTENSIKMVNTKRIEVVMEIGESFSIIWHSKPFKNDGQGKKITQKNIRKTREKHS